MTCQPLRWPATTRRLSALQLTAAILIAGGCDGSPERKVRGPNRMVTSISLAHSRENNDGRHVPKWGYIDMSGKCVISAQFDYALPFSEGLAPVLIGGKMGAIDKKGKLVIVPQFERMWPFSEGTAAVMSEGKWGFVDKNGMFVISPRFAVAWPFHEGMAVVAATRNNGTNPLASHSRRKELCSG